MASFLGDRLVGRSTPFPRLPPSLRLIPIVSVGALRKRVPGLGPVDVELSLGEEPRAVALDESVEIPKRSNHQLALAFLGKQMMGRE